MAREKFHERIGTIVDTLDNGKRISSPIERGGIRDTGFSLIVVLRGGSKERAERSLVHRTRDWQGFRVHGHDHVAGETFVTVNCPATYLDSLFALSFVLRIEQRERSASSASQSHLKPL